MNIFKEANRKKLRFPYSGSIMVEDLFDLNKEQVNKVYQTLSSMVESKETTLLDEVSVEDEDALIKIEIVKCVFNEKVEMEKRALDTKATHAKKQRIMEIMSKKENEDLESTSMDDLQKMLNEL